MRILTALVLCAGVVYGFASTPATADTVLDDDTRREFMWYYAPVILKTAHEPNGKLLGIDWITNATFDGDLDFTNNRENWVDRLWKFVRRG